MHRDHRVARLEQAINDQPAGPFNDHRQIVGIAVATQPVNCCRPPGFGMRQSPPVQHRPGVIEHGHIVSLARPVPAHVLHPGLLVESVLHSTVSRPFAGSSLFGPRSGMSLTPVRGLGVPGVAALKLAIQAARQRGHPQARPRSHGQTLRPVAPSIVSQ